MATRGRDTVESALQALQDSETRLQQVLDNTSALIFAKNAQGRYLFVNREFERAAGRGATDIIGRDDEAIFPPDLATRFRHNDLRVLHERRSIQVEEVADFGGGPRTYIASKFPLLDAQGTPYAVCGIATDITDRKRLEEALTASALAVSQSDEDALYRQLVQYLATILGVDAAFIAVHDPGTPGMLTMLAFYLDGKVQENFSYDQTGTPCETVVGRSFRIYPSNLFTLFPSDVDFSKLGFESYAGHPLVDGTGRSLGLIAAVSRGPLTQPAFVESVLRIFAVRVTAELERAAAAHALRASEANYREIFESSEDAIVVHDWDTGVIVDANRRACGTLGHAHKDLVGRKPHELESNGNTRPDEISLRSVEQARREGSASFEWSRRRPDGRLCWEEVRLKRATIGGQQRMLSITRDITERKLAEEALRASEEQYRTIFNSAIDALLLKDENHRIVDVNDAYLRMHGFRRDQMIGRHLSEFIPSDLQEQCDRLLPGILAGQPCRLEARTCRVDGSLLEVEINGVPMTYRGRPHALIMMRDLTESRRAAVTRAELEGRLRQAQKMEAIGRLTGGIAHDFNNLLTTIVGYVTLAAERESAIADPRLGSYLGQARRACDRARELIQQMLTFSRGQRGLPRVLRLNEHVREAMPALRSHLPDSIVLDVCADDVPAFVRIDPVQLEQLLLNLVLNARDALGGPGRICVEIRAVQRCETLCAGCRGTIEGDLVEICVHDNGPGIDPATAERIFEPFFTTKETGKGTGMGLAIVHGIAHENGGHVALETAPGQGARFRVLLPPASPEEAVGVPAPARPTAATPALSGSVLVVDDEETVAQFMCELLETWGLRAEHVLRGEAALAAVQAQPDRFDAVITDQAMPQMTGLELVRRLRAVRPDLPVVVHTGNLDAMPTLGEGDLRPTALLQKPVDPSRLRSVLAGCLGV